MAYLGAGASGVAYLLYSAALKHVDASEAGVYTNLIPIVGVITRRDAGRAAVAARDRWRLVVLVGVWLTSRQRDKQAGSLLNPKVAPERRALLQRRHYSCPPRTSRAP